MILKDPIPFPMKPSSFSPHAVVLENGEAPSLWVILWDELLIVCRSRPPGFKWEVTLGRALPLSMPQFLVSMWMRGHSFKHACMLSHFSHVQPFETLWTIAARLLCPWDSSGKNTRVVCHFFLQEIFLTQGSNSGLQHLLHCRRILYPLCHLVLAN